MSITQEITNVTVLVLDQSNTLSFAAAVDPMRAANRHAKTPLFKWHLATPRDQNVTLTSGLQVPAAPLQKTLRCDILLIVAGFDVQNQCTPTLCASLRRLAQTATTVGGVDGGPWVMAEAGLLNGFKATPHWEDFELFSTRFPQVEPLSSRYHISPDRMTSAGATPTIDMMLEVIRRDHGMELTDKVAASFLLDHSPASSTPQTRLLSSTRHSRITAKAHALMQQNLEKPLTMTQLADQLNLGLRALQKQFQKHLGTSAQKYYLALRLNEAQRQVLNTFNSLHDISLNTGFTSQSSFSRAYRSYFGTSARAQRSP